MSGFSISVNISENKYNEDDLYASVKTYSESEKEAVISLKTGDVLFDLENPDDIVIGSNYITVKKDDKKTYYNTDFKQIYVGTES